MNIELVLVKEEEKEILRNLLEKYDYEFSQYTMIDVNNLGLFGYSYLDNYWTEEKRFPYFIKVDGKLAGFVMVNDYPEANDKKTDYSMSEFFVIYKYRRMGVGKIAAYKAFNLHHGNWQLKYHPKNITSKKFWNNIINEYTKGDYTLIENYPVEKVDYEDGSKASVIFFKA